MAKISWKPGTLLSPVPPVLISCGTMEKPNVMTVAWTGIIASEPAMTYVSIRPERYSHELIKESGEFVINLTNLPLAKATDFCGVKSGRDIDKFKEMNLTAAACTQISAPMVEESPVSIECKVKSITNYGSHDMFLAEIVAVNVDDKYIDEDGKLWLEKSGLLAYVHGYYYTLGRNLGKFGFSVEKNPQKSNKKDFVVKEDAPEDEEIIEVSEVREERRYEREPRRDQNRSEGYRPRREGGEGYRPRREDGENSRPRRPSGEGYAPRREGGEGYRPRREGGEGYAPRREGGEGFRPRREGGEGFRPRREDGENSRPRRPSGEGYRPRREGEEGYRPRREGGETSRPRRPSGEGYTPRRASSEGYTPRRPAGEGYSENRKPRSFDDAPREKRVFDDRKPKRFSDDRKVRSFDDKPRRNFDDKPNNRSESFSDEHKNPKFDGKKKFVKARENYGERDDNARSKAPRKHYDNK